MKISVEKINIFKTLSYVQSIVEKKNTIPVLSNVLIQAKENSLILSDTDMDTLKVFQESIDAENLEVAGLYNSAKTKKVNGSDNVDAEIVKDLSDELPEKVLAS